MPKPPSDRAVAERCSRRAAPSFPLMIAASWLSACATPAPVVQEQPNVLKLSCTLVPATFLKQATELRDYRTDSHGHSVELWCDRDMFSAHWDLRVGWDEPADANGNRPPTVHRTATIAGCFFFNGDNTGPTIYQDPDHVFTKVQWTNKDPANDHKKHEFTYDYGSGDLTIVTTVPDTPPVTTVVRPQPSWEKLRELLPDPRHPVTASNP